ncbi:hypothetical protein Tco_0952692 [Tanacetum coccineum]|uniref:Reverse transcriptase domain-containing protein n=1 Tax=Tanacetum coccineum TaxID=301880 RepID=A0ABQ5DXQ8_9ASTR
MMPTLHLRKHIILVEKLLYDNSSPRPPEEFNSKNSVVYRIFCSSISIPVEGSDSLMEDIDIFLAPNDSMPPGIENDDYDSKGDICFLEEFLSNDSPSLPENEIAPDYEASRARGFVLRSLELQSLA